MTAQNEYVTHREFKERCERTDEMIESLRRDMNNGFLHLIERMDDKFEGMRNEFNDKLTQQVENAEERQKSDRRFWLTTAIAAITVTATILGLLLK